MKISASILSADFARLGEDVVAAIKAGSDAVHFDVMDGLFVPNLTVGPPVCASLREYLDEHGVKAPIDVHLMVNNPNPLIEDFAAAGADSISVHPESYFAFADDAEQGLAWTSAALEKIHKHGCKAGLALDIEDEIASFSALVPQLDQVLVMSVKPGFGGQEFIEESLDKIRRVREELARSSSTARIIVDGGVNLGTIAEVAEAGADVCVIGSGLFSADDYAKRISELRREVEASQVGVARS